MSYDIGIIKKNRKSEYYVYESNYTYNVSPMFKKAFGSDGIKILNEMTTVQAKNELSEALAVFCNLKEELTKLNPINGYGDYETAYQFLEKLYQNCIKFYGSKYIIKIC